MKLRSPGLLASRNSCSNLSFSKIGMGLVALDFVLWTFFLHGCIYTRNTWVLPRLCNVVGSHPQSNVDATCIQLGSSTRVLGTYIWILYRYIYIYTAHIYIYTLHTYMCEIQSTLYFTLNWEDQQRH